MAVVIEGSKCIRCSGCVSVCPVLALTNTEDDVVCDAGLCTSCGTCVKICPARAISFKS